MIDYVEGKLVYKFTNIAVVDISGIGFKINISLQCFDKLPDINNNIKLFTILKPKEDDIQLYGFIDKSERELFETITSVSGIGPKIALLILSSVSANEFIKLISSENILSLQKMQGIGKKTAERLVFELKDKIKALAYYDTSFENVESASTNKISNEAVMALIALGYSKSSAEKAVNQAFKDLEINQQTVENLIKKSLRFAIK